MEDYNNTKLFVSCKYGIVALYSECDKPECVSDNEGEDDDDDDNSVQFVSVLTYLMAEFTAILPIAISAGMHYKYLVHNKQTTL